MSIGRSDLPPHEHNVRLAPPHELPEPFEARAIAIPAGSAIGELMGHVKAATCRVLPKLPKLRFGILIFVEGRDPRIEDSA